MRKFFLILAILIPLTGFSQINQTDVNGLRQGLWKKNYPNGQLMYEGFFKDDIPAGNWVRYHAGGNVRARIKYEEDSDAAFATLYDEGGNKMGEGIFIDEKREGKWSFFSRNEKISEEEYRGGIKHGISKRYYPSGELLEESEWQGGQQQGSYRVFFQNGNPYLQCKFIDGKRNGICLSYFRNGRIEMEAYYINNLRDKEWKFYDESGKLMYVLKYDQGNLLNPEVRDSVDQLQNAEFERKSHIADPEDFLQDPSQYMMQMQKFR